MIAHQFAIALVRKQLSLFNAGRVAGINHNVRLEIEHLLELAQRDIQQVADAAGKTLKKPDVRTRTSQIDMTEPFSTHLGLSYLDSAFIADHSAMLHALILAAQALPVRNWTKDTRAEESITLWLEGPVIDRLRLCHLTVRPLPDLLR